MSSILGWINLFDLGLGNGLRNNYTKVSIDGTKDDKRTLVSTTFYSLLFISFIVFILFLFGSHFISWSHVFNVNIKENSLLSQVMLISVIFFCLQFVFKIVSFVLLAEQKSALNDLINLLGQLFVFIVIFFFSSFVKKPLVFISFVFTGIPCLIYIIAFIIKFYIKDKSTYPKFSFFKFSYIKNLLGLGLKFFFIQIAVVILFGTSNIIITQLFGPGEVTNYNVIFKLFSIFTTIFSIILTPIWSAVTNAYVNNDFLWIVKAKGKLLLLLSLFTLAEIIMIMLSPLLIKIWIGEQVSVNMYLVISIAVYVAISNWNSIYATIINGIGTIKISLFLAVIQAFLYIPLAIFLGKLLGLPGVVISLCVILSISSFISPIQLHKILNHNAKGIWLK
jgi:O-antigen/teichoic acid export membrane protein